MWMEKGTVKGGRIEMWIKGGKKVDEGRKEM